MIGWIYNAQTEDWRRVDIWRRGGSWFCYLDTRHTATEFHPTGQGGICAAGDWRWHPRQVPPCLECGDLCAVPGSGAFVRTQYCARCRPTGACDPAFDNTKQRIQLRNKGK